MDIYTAVTDRIIAQMEQGIIPWKKPWIANAKAISHTTGKAYSLLNQMLLGRPGEYITFKQCQEAGGHIRKGEKASMVVFWKWIEQEDKETTRSERPKGANSGEEIYPQPRSCDAKRNSRSKEIPFLRYYNVFHIDQCEGITAKHSTPGFPLLPAEHRRS